ncbi:high-affinity iron permease [Marasmius tenuissimus]|uniref:High-affinity iron permease n=1 Tax=Marasmius tenuissimus TaxID=585030 RepID=A0ABR2ZIC6_9AGAR
MAKNLFSVPIFFIVFRETLEAAIIISVLLGLAEQIVHEGRFDSSTSSQQTQAQENDSTEDSSKQAQQRRLVKRMRLQIFLGAATGFFIALAIGAAFIAVWFTRASDLWAKSEELWEGIFSLIASLMIFVMGVTMLKMERGGSNPSSTLGHGAGEYLQLKSNGKSSCNELSIRRKSRSNLVPGPGDAEGKTGRWALFILPFITVLREGMEAVVFVGGVALGQQATSIPIAAIVGLIVGSICGWLIYQFASRTTLRIFLVTLTSLLLLIGAGLFSRSIGAFERNAFNKLLGADIDDAGGDGPGSYDVRGNVWHLDCCNPDNYLDGQGWSVFNAIFGWTNSATLGTVLGYVFYWIAVMVTLVWMKYKEGRTKLFGMESEAAKKRKMWRKDANEREGSEEKVSETVATVGREP